ncbi:MAG: RNA 2',3'-cyclic phosphodiesterase [Betaproteobacteria bacterium]|nr:RNA 2',3'-cyclic phosphodiesterase [Betaproteobacteria bacterium]
MPDRPHQRKDLTDPAKKAPDPGARVFFALWPDASVRCSLDELAGQVHKACGGRRMRAESAHLTLVFVGQVVLARVESLKSVASGVRVPAFDLRLDRVGCWKRNRIAWLGTRETPLPLAELVQGLEQGLGREGFKFDQRPYFPHLTLARSARCEAPLPTDADIRWRVEEFVLVRSSLLPGGAAYGIIGRWPLR